MAQLRHLATRKLGLLLIDGFALMSYAAVIEAFRAANSLAEGELYSWAHVAVAEDSAAASNGALLLCEHRVGASLDWDILFVFAGGDPAVFRDVRVFAWLRQLAARGVEIAGVSGGPYLLARAGLLEERRATIHWEHAEAFRDEFPRIELRDELYVIDRGRITCAGGTAGLDLALELIERDHGPALADRVGEWFIRTEPRRGGGAQRRGLRERYGVRHEGLLRALEAMESALETPHSREVLARTAGLSVRQLERLFQSHLQTTVAEIYLRVRLEHARRLLRTTSLSVLEIAVASGFVSSSHFARVYRRAYGAPPGQTLRSASAGPPERSAAPEGKRTRRQVER